MTSLLAYQTAAVKGNENPTGTTPRSQQRGLLGFLPPRVPAQPWLPEPPRLVLEWQGSQRDMLRFYDKDDPPRTSERERLASVLDGDLVHDGIVLVGPLLDYAAAN